MIDNNSTVTQVIRQKASSSTLSLVAIALRRPLFLVAVLYSIAICYEQAIEIEVFKPYRILGMCLIMGAIFTKRLRSDRLSRLAIVFLVIGFLAGLPEFITLGGRDDVFFNMVLIWTFNVATYLAIAGVVRSRTDIIILAVVHSVALLTAAYGIAQDAALIEKGINRTVGDFKNPANATVSMLFSGLVLITLLRTPWARRRINGILITIFKIGIPLFLLYIASLTGTRSGALLLVAGFVLYTILIMRRRSVLVAAIMASAMVTVLTVSSRFEQTLDNLTETNILAARVEKKGLDTDRLYLWKSGLDSVVDSFGIGRGLGRYPEVHKQYFAQYAHLSDPRWMDSDLTLHNDYVNALVEHGIIGFIIFIFFCRELFRTANGIIDPVVRAIGLSFLLGMAINGLTHTGLPYFCAWFYFALIVSWRAIEKRESEILGMEAQYRTFR